ncbi:hypothetical protein SAMN05444376_3093 [Bacteroides clarus YIT 12056]|uniref:Conserved domain protein n=1 Tax=Bacteroides clarus YIT 12056 TaxID=762984 RepID=A0ABP2KVX7_9BACE|nr:conserved domain protein [Bacteroides clarus YIT 12056]SHH35980.1 hypothetical protein SAMN05444376_3093 [Bacteroides clarus YIT 12056]
MKCLFALRTFTNKTHENGNNTDCKNNKSERGIYLLKKEFKIIFFTNLLNFKTEITTAINHNSPQPQHKNHPETARIQKSGETLKSPPKYKITLLNVIY